MIALGYDPNSVEDSFTMFPPEAVEQMESSYAAQQPAAAPPPDQLTPAQIAYLCTVVRQEQGIVAECQNPACYGLNPGGCNEVFAAQNATMGPELQAWVILTGELGLAPSASVADVDAALIARGVSPDDVGDWLPACNYDVNCFRQTLNQEMYQAQQRGGDVKTAKIGAVLGLVVVVVAGAVAIRGMR
ncbi:MAG TPA: hypothetical protein VMW52_09025 [Phycisphaerae bacterium]|nr:hypothetical protein [Phycisphaerae bacterium]